MTNGKQPQSDSRKKVIDALKAAVAAKKGDKVESIGTPKNIGDAVGTSKNSPEVNLRSLDGQIGNRVARINKLQKRLDTEKEGSEAYKTLKEQIETLYLEVEKRKKIRDTITTNDSVSAEPEADDLAGVSPLLNVLAQLKTLNSLPDLETLLFNAHNYDSNKDKEFYDESMRTSNVTQTAPFNKPSAGVFTPPKGYGPLIGPVQVDSDLPPKEFFSKLKIVAPIGLGLLSALPTIIGKIVCTTALTPIVPWMPLAVGIVSASYNLRKDYLANKDDKLSTWANFKKLGNRQSMFNAAGAGLVGATSSFVGILAVDALIDTFLPEAFCTATEVAPAELDMIIEPEVEVTTPEPAPVVEAPDPEPDVISEPETQQTQTETVTGVETATYEIQSGDTLWQITAEHFGLENTPENAAEIQKLTDFVAEINGMNGLEANGIQVGDSISLTEGSAEEVITNNRPDDILRSDWNSIDADIADQNGPDQMWDGQIPDNITVAPSPTV